MKAKLVVVVLLGASAASAQTPGPSDLVSISVVHAATRVRPQTPETGLAPGSLCEVDVSRLYAPRGSLLPDDPVTLRFRAPGAGEAREMTVLAARTSFPGISSGFTALVPPDTPLGQAVVIAVAASGVLYSTSVWITGSNFGVFTDAYGGNGAALAQVWRGDPLKVGLTTPVQAGEWITLWGTGLGSARASAVTVEVAGIGVAPDYAGPAPGLAGVDQINFRFPAGVPDDCYIPVAVNVGGRIGNTPTIAAAGMPGPCRHRLGLSPEALSTLDQGGSVPLSQNSFVSGLSPDEWGRYRRDEAVTLLFLELYAPGVQAITGALSAQTTGCRISQNAIAAGILSPRAFDAGLPMVVGSTGVRLPMEGGHGFYSRTFSAMTYVPAAIPASFFVTGDWWVNVPGGKDIAAFQAGLRIPPMLRWTNRASVSTVSREKDLTLTWDSAGYTDREWVQAGVYAGSAAAFCQAPATAGSITIPAALISQLPGGGSAAARVQLTLSPARDEPALYTVPLVGGGTFPGVFSLGYSDTEPAELR
ncbi:MAG: hypothetical protein ACE141_05665 [Bryobacteraceae bacterium]